MTCRICDQKSTFSHKAVILSKYDIDYYRCSHCGFIQTEDPYWQEEAYSDSINITDTGILCRNIHFSKITALLLFFFFNRRGKFLDFAGGYGIFTRLMRDIGFDFYWQDKYSKNLVARGFEYNESSNKIELITAFEAFEHFVNPIDEIEDMLKISQNILFSTELIPNNTTPDKNWWYWGLEHGQHIAFYSAKTFQYISKKYSLNFYTDGKKLHLLTNRNLPKNILKFVSTFRRVIFLQPLIKKLQHSKTVEDMVLMIGKQKIHEDSL